MTLAAYHGKKEIKEKYLSRVIAHRKADNLIRGTGWTGKKGCAIGCTLENYNHALYPVELGIPEWLAKVEDRLFEGMNLKKSKSWPEVFLKAIKPGVDLEKAKAPFMICVLKSTLKYMAVAKYDAKKFPDVAKAIKLSKAAVNEMIRLWKEGVEDKDAAASAGWSAASAGWSASENAASAAASAGWSAASAAASAGWSAASAARSAESAAWSASENAASAARSASWSASESASESAASRAYDYYANELIKILKRIK